MAEAKDFPPLSVCGIGYVDGLPTGRLRHGGGKAGATVSGSLAKNESGQAEAGKAAIQSMK